MPGLPPKFDEYSIQPRKNKAFESPLQRMSCLTVTPPFFSLLELKILDSKA